MLSGLDKEEFIKIQKYLKLSNKAIAEICDVTPVTVTKWRKGECRVTEKNAEKLLELTPDFYKNRNEINGKLKLEIEFDNMNIKSEPSAIKEENKKMLTNYGVNIVVINNNNYN